MVMTHKLFSSVLDWKATGSSRPGDNIKGMIWKSKSKLFIDRGQRKTHTIGSHIHLHPKMSTQLVSPSHVQVLHCDIHCSDPVATWTTMASRELHELVTIQENGQCTLDSNTMTIDYCNYKCCHCE